MGNLFSQSSSLLEKVKEGDLSSQKSAILDTDPITIGVSLLHIYMTYKFDEEVSAQVPGHLILINDVLHCLVLLNIAFKEVEW